MGRDGYREQGSGRLGRMSSWGAGLAPLDLAAG